MHDVCFMVHRDVKPANILLKKGDALVTDFGFTKALGSETDQLIGTDGSPYYKAPEILNREPFSFPVDVYALGVTMYEVLVGQYPYSDAIKTEEQLRIVVTRGERPDLKALPAACPASLIKLMQDCWKGVPEERPKMTEVYERLKAIYVETMVPAGTPSYNFWLQHFGDDIVDSAPLSEILKAMPEQGSVYDRWRRQLLCIPASVPDDFSISLAELNNLVYWYGNWYDPNVLREIITALSSHTWLVGYIGRGEAEAAVMDYFSKTGRSCFLVRASKTKPVETPFTITLYDRGAINHRIMRSPDGSLSCPTLGAMGSQVARANGIFALIEQLQANGSLKAEPYAPIGPQQVY